MQTQTAREYETVYILKHDTSKEEAQRVASRLSEVVERLSGKLTHFDNWGVRRLAYPIQKASRGNFVYVKYAGYSDLVKEIERNLRLVDSVVRYQTVVLRDGISMSELKSDDVRYNHRETHGQDFHEITLEERLGLRGRAQPPAQAAPEASVESAPENPAEAPIEAAEKASV